MGQDLLALDDGFPNQKAFSDYVLKIALDYDSQSLHPLEKMAGQRRSKKLTYFVASLEPIYNVYPLLFFQR
jgi:hypothetical protein